MRNWTRVGEQAFITGVGMGSREQLVDLDLVMIFRSAAGATSVGIYVGSDVVHLGLEKGGEAVTELGCSGSGA